MERNFNSRMLNEGKNPLEVAKYYLKNQPEALQKLTDRDNLLLRKLASLDAEFDPAKFEAGKMFPWLMTMWKRNDPALLSLLKSGPNSPENVKFRNAQLLFAKPAFRKSLGTSDVNKFASIEDFMQKVSASFVEKDEMPESPRFDVKEINDDIRDGSIAKTSISNDTYLVVTPLKKKGACKYGNVHMATSGGRWCTAKEKDNAFDSYKDGILYIFMDRKDGYKSKYQLYYKGNDMQFKDERNQDFDYEAFFDENTDMFDRLFPEIAKWFKGQTETQIPGIEKVYRMLPSKYKKEFRERASKYATGLLRDMLLASDGQLENPEEAIANEDVIGMDYDDITFHDGGFTVETDLDNISDSLQSWYWVYKNGYDGYSFDSDEYRYIQNYVPKDRKQELIDLVRFFKPEFSEKDFDEEGKLYEAMSEGDAYKYFERLFENYATEYSNAVNNGQSAFVDREVEGLPFTIRRNGLFIPYGRFTAYCLENIVDGVTLKDMIDYILDKENIDDERLNNHWETADVNFDGLFKQMSQDIDDAKEKIEDDMEDMEGYKDNHQKLQKYIKDLGFTKDAGDTFRKKTEFAYMVISNPDYRKGTVYMEYRDLKNDKQTHNGDIQIDNLPKYATMQMMFESVRRLVRNILSNSINENKNINEGVDYSNVEFDIKRLFRKYDNELPSEENTVRGLRDSLELIDGNGAIEEKSHYDRKGDRLMYKEMLDNDNLILVIHAALKRPPYGGEYGYQYEIGLYRNNPQSYQIGGGYGASGIVGTKHTRLIGYGDYDIVHHNKSILSKVIGFLKEKLENPQLSLNDKEYKVGDRVDTKISKTLPYPQQYQYYNRWGVLTGIDAENDKYTLRMNDSGEEETFKKDSLQ